MREGTCRLRTKREPTTRKNSENLLETGSGHKRKMGKRLLTFQRLSGFSETIIIYYFDF